jgi:transcriptional regulator with XRE-family HTH domain
MAIKHSKKQQRLWSLLRRLRQEAGLHQTQLAKKLNRPQSFVSKYESGEKRLDIFQVQEICVALGSSLKEFVEIYERFADES